VSENGPMTSEPATGGVPTGPACGARLVPVVFGYAEYDSELCAMAERGEVHLGGCPIRVGMPPWWCPACACEVPDQDAGS
jgi:hypothetical protein